MAEDTQEQFDWMQDSAKCVEGLKFDLNKDYTFDLVFEEISKHTMKRGKGDEAEVILYKKGDKKGQPVMMYTVPFKERETGVEFKLDFFANDSYRVNPENPELEDEIVTFSRKLGYQPVVDGEFSLKDFLQPGLAIVARLMYQKPTKPGEELDEKTGKIVDSHGKPLRNAYTGINIDTIVKEGESGESADESSGGKQAEIEEISKDDQEKIQQAIKDSKAKKMGDLTTYLSKKKMFKLVEIALRMKDQGLIKLA